MGRRERDPEAFKKTLIFLILLVAGPLIIVWFTVVPFVLRAESVSWTQIECRVLRSGIDRGKHVNEEVSYEYVIGGKKYYGGRIQFGQQRPREGKGGAPPPIQLEYPAGAVVPCFVDPKNPERSVLRRLVGNDVTLSAIAGAAMLSVGAWGLFFRKRQPASTRR